MLEWLKRHAWKACVLQKGIKGSNPFLSANPMKKADHMVGFLRIRAARKASFPDSPGSQKMPGRNAPTAFFISGFALPRRRRAGMSERSDEIPERKQACLLRIFAIFVCYD